MFAKLGADNKKPQGASKAAGGLFLVVILLSRRGLQQKAA
jgi:hypothetical protein